MTGSSGSNFKRQNTVDAATIKENTARVSASRPSAPKNSPGQLDTSEFFSLSCHFYHRNPTDICAIVFFFSASLYFCKVYKLLQKYLSTSALDKVIRILIQHFKINSLI